MRAILLTLFFFGPISAGALVDYEEDLKQTLECFYTKEQERQGLAFQLFNNHPKKIGVAIFEGMQLTAGGRAQHLGVTAFLGNENDPELTINYHSVVVVGWNTYRGLLDISYRGEETQTFKVGCHDIFR